MAALTGVLLVLAVILARRASGTILNAGSLAALGWLVAFALCAAPGGMSPMLTEESSVLTASIAIAVLAGYSAPVLLGVGPKRSGVFDVERVRRRHIQLLALLAGYVILDVAQQLPLIISLGGWSALWDSNGGGASLRSAAIDARLEAINAGDGGFIGALGYVLFIGEVSLVTGAVLWNSGLRLLGAMPLVLLAARSLVTLDRTKFVIALIIFLLCLGIVNQMAKPAPRELSVRARRGRLIAGGFTLAIATVVLLAPLQARNAGTERATGLASLMQYLMSSLAGLNFSSAQGTLLSQPVDGQTGALGEIPGFGAYTYYGFFDLLSRFGIPTPFAPRYNPFATAVLYGEPFTTNTKTLIWNLTMDFGQALGFVCLLSMFLLAGLLFASARRGNFQVTFAYATLGAALTWSFFGNSVLADFHYTVAAVASVVITRGLFEVDASPSTPTNSSTRATWSTLA